MTWIRTLGPQQVAAVVSAASAAEAVDGVAPLSGHVLEALDRSTRDQRSTDEYILATLGPDVIGVAVAHGDDPVELFVAPAHRREGLGTELLTTALTRTGGVWAHGDLPGARALASRFRLVETRRLLQMRRPLDRDWAAQQMADATLPAGVRLRTFEPGRDEEQFLGVNARAFDWHPEQGRLDLDGLHAEMEQPWFDPAGFFLAVDDQDRVLGFHWTKVHAGDPPLGEVYVLGVDPLATIDGVPARGLGTPLTAAGLVHLADAGLRTVLLYVEGDNSRALKLYARMGFEMFSVDVVFSRAD